LPRVRRERREVTGQCISCRLELAAGISLGGDLLHFCAVCWKEMTPAERSAAQAAYWQYVASCRQAYHQEQIAAATSALYELVRECVQQARAENGFPWERN